MYYIHKALLKNNYPDWIVKEPEKKPPTATANPDTGLEAEKILLISVPYVSGLSERIEKDLTPCQCTSNL